MSTTSLSIEEIVQKTTDLPSIPAAALAVMREAESETGSANSVAHHIAQDQALAARVLRLSNSAFYGLAGEVTDLQESVVVLGMRCVRNLAMVASTYPWMVKPLTGYCLGPKEMWTHSFGVAIAAQEITKLTRTGDPDVAFTAGLLHNLGKVALSIWLENRIPMFIAVANQEDLTFNEVERKLLGYDHAEVGEYLGKQWNLPKQIREAIRYHHEPSAATPTSPIIDSVHIGDFLTMSMGFGLGGDGLRYDYDPEAWARLNLEVENMDQVADRFVSSYQEYEKLFEAMNKAA